jgi:hypothetical protein
MDLLWQLLRELVLLEAMIRLFLATLESLDATVTVLHSIRYIIAPPTNSTNDAMRFFPLSVASNPI